MSKIILNFIAICSGFLLLAGCGGGGSSSSSQTNSSSVVISGVVAANFVSGATVNLYSISPAGTQGALIGSGTTDSLGNFSIHATGATISGGGILAIASGGNYVDEATNATKTLTSMQAVTNSIASQTLNVTPMSSAAWIIAQNLVSQDGFDAAVNIANSEISTYIGANINSSIGTSLTSAVASNNCSTIKMNAALTAVSQYQANSGASMTQAVTQLANEASTNLPATSLSGKSGMSIASLYANTVNSLSLPATCDIQSNCTQNATDFSSQLATVPFLTSASSLNWSGPTWGPKVNNFPQTICSGSSWQQQRVMYAYENIAVPAQWNYCHHHSASWYPGTTYSVDINTGLTSNAQTDALSLYCSAQSFYISGTQASTLNFRSESSQITNAYRWNSAYAKANVPNYNTIVSQETNSNSELVAFLNALYPTPSSGKMIDTTWFNFSTIGSPNLTDGQSPSGLYPRQAQNQFLNGVDCSDLTGWAYQIALNITFSTNVGLQSGQTGNNTSLATCQNPLLQAQGAAGSFVIYNGSTISASTLAANGGNRSSILNSLQPGDLLFIKSGPSADTNVSHVITWTGKKIAAAGSGVTATTIGLDLIAPADVDSNTTRTIGDWVIIDSHTQGADYRDFSGWYVNSLWGIRRVINPQNQTCQ